MNLVAKFNGLSTGQQETVITTRISIANQKADTFTGRFFGVSKFHIKMEYAAKIGAL